MKHITDLDELVEIVEIVEGNLREIDRAKHQEDLKNGEDWMRISASMFLAFAVIFMLLVNYPQKAEVVLYYLVAGVAALLTSTGLVTFPLAILVRWFARKKLRELED